jgi:radical SAM superfamily enzyme YgiQ (UPF0313 family)
MNILLVNPWIYDFSAYDLWLKPLGLLYIAGILKNLGLNIYFIDCMDRCNPEMKRHFYKRDKYGCGHYYSEEVMKPEVINFVPRKYKKYGIDKEIFINMLKSIPKPQIILVSSGMTYWYPGVIEVIKILKNYFVDTTVLLGGIYATLCYEHAKKFSGADYVFSGNNISNLIDIISELTKINFGHKYIPTDFTEYPRPCYDLYNELEYVAIRTSVGCIFNCSYCASTKFNKIFIQKNPETVIDEIEYFYEKYGVRDFAFYDDALLVNADGHILKILDTIKRDGLKCFFHTPNGLHAKFINEKLAEILYESGFINPRLGFETIDEIVQQRTGNKVNTDELLTAIENLIKSGYKNIDIIVYIMLGMPEQDLDDVEKTVEYLKKLNVRISLSEYSPIPFTDSWYKTGLRDDDDPLLHNKSVYHLYRYKDWQKIREIKDDVFNYNKMNIQKYV